MLTINSTKDCAQVHQMVFYKDASDLIGVGRFIYHIWESSGIARMGIGRE